MMFSYWLLELSYSSHALLYLLTLHLPPDLLVDRCVNNKRTLAGPVQQLRPRNPPGMTECIYLYELLWFLLRYGQ